MESELNTMATTVGEIFSTTEKIVAQHDDVAVGDMVETLVIEFDQDKYEELLVSGKSSPVSTRKYRKIVVAKTEVASLDGCNNASGSIPIVSSVSDETVEASKPAVSSNRTMIVFDKTDSTSNSVANSEAFSKAKTLVITTNNKAGNMPKMNSVSQETIHAVSRLILKSAVNNRMSKVFYKTKADRNLVSKPV